MGVRSLTRVAFVTAAALMLASRPASAQLVTFSSSGLFTGSQCAPAWCSFGGYIISWSGASSASWTPPADVDLGNFRVNCISVSCYSDNIMAGTAFMLTISQTGPTAGSGSFTGTLSGGLGWDPTTSSLFWTPNQNSVTIGGITYTLSLGDTACPVSNTECVKLNAPDPNNNPAYTPVRDDVGGPGGGGGATTTTPEPATVALMTTGLIGLIPVARRRRRRN